MTECYGAGGLVLPGVFGHIASRCHTRSRENRAVQETGRSSGADGSIVTGSPEQQVAELAARVEQIAQQACVVRTLEETRLARQGYAVMRPAARAASRPRRGGSVRERSWLVPTLSQSGPPGIRARHGSEDSVVVSVLGTDALHARLRARCSHVDQSETCAEERRHE